MTSTEAVPVAVVTGAATGQGFEHARRLTLDGFLVVATDVRPCQPADLLGDFRILDVTGESHWDRLIGSVLHDYGRLDVLVNNAGIEGASVAIEETSLAGYLEVIGVNQIGCFLGMRTVIPSMRAARTGSIINISSIAGMGGAIGRIPYQASKWAIRGMTRSAAIELAGAGVRVNAIVPGWVDTSMAANAVLSRDEIAAGVPMKRIAEPAEISALVSFLASKESAYITGTDLVIDGGIRARI